MPPLAKGTRWRIEPAPVTPEQRAYLLGLAAPHFLNRSERVESDTLAFLAHLYTSTLYDLPGPPDGAPVAATFIRKHFRYADWRHLQATAVITVEKFSREGRRSRRYRISEPHLQALRGLGATAATSAALVHPLTGKPARRPRSQTYTDQRNRWPPLIDRALRKLGPARFDDERVRAHLDALRSQDDDAARWRFTQDWACYQAVIAHRPTRVSETVFEYRPAYRVSSTGRLTHHGGGLQNASRAMKAAAYGTIDGAVNYDVRSSQATGLVMYADAWGLPVTHLAAYVRTTGAKHTYAAMAGVPVETWKDALYAVLFGAPLPDPPHRPHSRTGIGRVLRRSYAEEEVGVAYERLHGALRPIYDDVQAWRRHLVGEHMAEHGVPDRRTGEVRLRNATGLLFSLNGRSVIALQRSAAAFMLQGLEAAFIHALTVTLASRGVVVMANEHDGLVVLGTVTEDDVASARALSGFHAAILEEKSFI